MKPRRGDVVRVVWVDSQHLNYGWREPSAYRADVGIDRHYTAGFWMGRKRGHVIIAASTGTLDKVSTVWSIPDGCVRRVRVIERSGKRIRRSVQ